MVLEHALLQIHPGQESDFEAALPAALAVITGDPGCRSAQVHACIEAPSQYLLLVHWDSVDAHNSFRNSPAFADWRAIVQPFWVSLPLVEHFTLAAEANG